MPTTYNVLLHSLATVLFCVLGIIHLSIEMCHGIKNKAASIILFIGILGLLGVILPVNKLGLRFWFIECIGMSGIIWYTPALVVFGGDELEKKKEGEKGKTRL